VGDATLYWTKVAAIGQVAGAIATFLAVVIALVQSRAERSLRVRVRARLGLIVDGRGQTEVMTYEVENTGLRPVVVNGMHWATGFINVLGILPPPLRLKSAFQMPDYEWPINENFPWRLGPGESKSTHIRRQDFIDEFCQPNEHDLFRRFFWQRRPKLFWHRAGVAINTRRGIVFGRVDRNLTSALEEAYLG